MSLVLDICILATGWLHVLLAPYTKVEESFNLHATHDVLLYGISPATLDNYDHFTFPGVVPRSYLGSVLLAWLSTPIIHLCSHLGLISSKFDLQIIIRLVLTTLNALTLCFIRRAVSRRFGQATSFLFVLLTCTQFHVPFWMGRTLPNIFALIPVNISTYLLINRNRNARRPSQTAVESALALLIFTAVIFRAEVALLAIVIAFQSLLNGNLRLSRFILVGFLASISAVALTVAVDSYFWRQWPMWPELQALYFNVYEGKSAEWGVSPWHTYFTSHLPKLLLGALPLSLPGILDRRIRAIVLPCVLYVGLISLLGHKEWRFIVYVIPPLNIAAARGARWMLSWRKSTFVGQVLFLTVVGTLLANCLATVLLTRTSMANYPGGVALALFNDEYADTQGVHVHISNLAAQTGASLFLHTHAPPYAPYLTPPAGPAWVYNKTEHLTLEQLAASPQITHLIMSEHVWDTRHAVEGFARWAIERDVRRLFAERGLAGVKDVLRMERTEQLWITERTANGGRGSGV